MKYIDPKTGLNFTNVNKPVLLTGGKISSDRYNVSSPYASVITDEQLPVAKLLNALDIDWCNAILPNSDLENGGPIGIQSTADLLKLIDNMNTHYISANGTPGSNGQNGQYVVFAYKNAESCPQKPENSTTINNLIDGWSVTPENPIPPEVTWMSQCLVDRSGQYGTWTTPIRITGAQGANGADGEDGVDGINGSCVEFIYTRNNTGLYPSIPVAVNIETTDDWSGEDQNNIIWTDNPQGVQADMKWEFVSMRTKPAGAISWQAFSSPVIWSKWGETGMDGDGVEYIYKHFDTEKTFGSNDDNPAQWEAVQEDEYYGPNGHQWSDGPQGVNTEFQYEYVAVRKKKPTGWQAYSTPTLWAKYGPQGAQGAQGVMGQAGQDGQNGSHWVFAYKNSTTQPDTIESGTSLEYSGWDSSPVNPTPPAATWMSQTLVDTNNQYGEWTEPIRITGAQGEAGADGANGSNIEFIYKRFNQLQTFDNNYNPDDNPVAWINNENYQDTDYRGPEGHQWTDNPQGVQSDLMFEYVSTRVKPAGTNTAWGSFSTPVVWSKWGEKGQDGDGVEYIYKHFETIQNFDIADKGSIDYNNPACWEAQALVDGYQGPIVGEIDYRWSDGPQGISDQLPYEYVAVRKKKSTGWQSFSRPTLWAKYGPQGAQGVAGANGINGQNGKAGLWYDYAGEWTEGKSVTNTEQIGYYVSIGNQFYMNVKDTGIANNSIPVNNGELNEGWQSMGSDRNYYIGKAFFGEYAAFGNAIINGDWMISKNGVIDGNEYSADEFVGYFNPITGTGDEVQHAYLLFDPQFPQNNPMHLEFTGEWNESQINFDNPESNNNLDNVYIKDVEFYLTANKDYKISLYLYNNTNKYTYEYCLLDNENNYINVAQGYIIAGQYIQYDPVYKITINNANTDNYNLSLTASYSGTYKLRLIRKTLSNGININTTNKPSYFYAYVKPLIVFEPKYVLNLLTGAVYEHDLHVNGIIKAQALYPQTRVISDNITIDNSNLANMYIIRTANKDDTISIKLPDTRFNQNLELKFFVESGNATINFTGQILYTPLSGASLGMIRHTARFGGRFSQNYLTGVGALPLYTLTTLVATYFPEILFTERTANIYNYGLAYNIDPRSSSFVIGENGTQATFIGNQSAKYENKYKAGHQSFTFEEIFTKYNDYIDSLEDNLENNMYKLEIDPISGFQGAQASLDNIHTYNKQNEYAIGISKSEGEVKDEAEYVWVATTGYLTETNRLNGLPVLHG